MIMNGLKNFSMMAATAIVLSAAASCISEESEQSADRSRVELRLSTGVEVQTRAAFPATDTQIPNGQTVAVYVDDADDDVQLYGKNTLTANGSGGFTGGTAMFFPENGHDVDIYAFHTNATLPADNTFPAAAITHTVSSDQSTLAGYAPSDLLYARATDVARTSSAVPLTFRHLLSKLQVAIVAGDGLTATSITGLTVGGTKLQATFTPDKATAPGAVAVSAAGTAVGITLGYTVSTDFAAPQYNDAIIVPQTVAAGTDFITVHTTGDNLVYKIPSGSGVTFQGGKKYIYKITARLTGLMLESSITDWDAIGDVGGEAAAKAKKNNIEIAGITIQGKLIPSGTFLMGSSDGSNIGDTDGSGLNVTVAESGRTYAGVERQHWVKLTRSFYMSKYEITRAEYAAFLNSNGIGSSGKKAEIQGNEVLVASSGYGVEWVADPGQWKSGSDRDSFPVANVTWYGAKAFAEWAGGDLPTEAQWEYACRGGLVNTPFGVGDGSILTTAMANFNNPSGAVVYKKVGTYPANAWGLHDMHGNVSEWCLDQGANYADYPPGGEVISSPVTDPVNTTDPNRMRRGGDYYTEDYQCRSAYRNMATSPDNVFSNIGFRIIWYD
jgi:formylglycine-generating enzyme required for sulfatase activity